MSDIPFYSKKIEQELCRIDSATAVRLLDHYDACSADRKLDFVAALVGVVVVSEARRRLERS